MVEIVAFIAQVKESIAVAVGEIRPAFTPEAELLNGRAAMVGFLILFLQMMF